MDDAVAYFLNLRVQVRSNRHAVRLVDHCLRLIAEAATADAVGCAALEEQVEALREALEAEFGPRRVLVRH